MNTRHPIRDEIQRILSMTNPKEEWEAWQAAYDTHDGTRPFFYLAQSYLAMRLTELQAIVAGFAKPGTAILALVESLKARASGPPEPLVYRIDEHRVCVWLWKTSAGPKLIAFQRAPSLDGSPFGPDWWRQLPARPIRDEQGIEGIFMLGDVVVFNPSLLSPIVPEVQTPFDEKLTIPCHQPGCKSDSVAECGHPTMEEQIGDNFRATRVKCDVCSAAQPGACEVFHVPGRCPSETSDSGNGPCPHPWHDNPALVLPCPECGEWAGDEESDDSPAVAEATAPTATTPAAQPAAQGTGSQPPGWLDAMRTVTQTPEAAVVTVCSDTDMDCGEATAGSPTDTPARSAPGDDNAGCGEGVDAEDVPWPDEEPVVHCPGNWVPPGDKPFACFPCKTDSDRVYKWNLQTGPFALRAKLTEITCPRCREVIDQVMKHGKWLGPNVSPASKRGWYPPVDPTALDKARENMQGAINPRPANPNGSCACGHDRTAHRTDGDCRSCPCVAFREGEPQGELETPAMREESAERVREKFVRSIDMGTVRKQKKSKLYRPCELCSKIVDRGDEWVAPFGKKTRRAHLECADKEIVLLKAAEAEAAAK